MTPQSPSEEAPWDLTQCSQSPLAALLYFPESHQQSETSSLSKVFLVLRKTSSCRAPNLGCRGAESPGWFNVLQKNFAWDMMHKRVSCHDEAANHQVPIAVAFWISWIVSTEECSSLVQNLMQIDCCIRSVTLNGTATQYTCSLNSVYHPHWLVQWSHHCSHMRIPVRSPWLPGYIDVVQTIVIILTMAGPLPDRLCISKITSFPAKWGTSHSLLKILAILELLKITHLISNL